MTPRPFGPAYLAYTASLIQNILDGKVKRELDLSAWDRDVLATLQAYLNDILSLDGYLAEVARGEQKLPGQNPAFDRNFTNWLREKSRWVPIRIMLTADLDELAKAGFDRKQVEAFRANFESLVSAERSEPGQADAAPAAALLVSARALGEANNPKLYPEPVAMARETHFNRFAPFARAPIAYGAGLVLLLISLGLSAGRRVNADSKLDLGLYTLGMLAFMAGIGLEVYGFYLRVSISGWAPVTNMYETVIWVAAVAAVLGLVLEGIFRNKYSAIAATGMALLATLLAANVPLLDSNIKSLDARPPGQLLAHDPRPDDRLQLRRLHSGAGARSARDRLLPLGDLSPRRELRRGRLALAARPASPRSGPAGRRRRARWAGSEGRCPGRSDTPSSASAASPASS